MNNPSSNPYFHDLLVNTNDLIHFANIEGKIEMINPAWLNTLKYSEREVIGKSIYDFVFDEDRVIYQTNRSEAILKRAVDDFQVRFKANDGKIVLLEGNIRPFYLDNNLIHTRGVFRDVTFKITEDKEREEQFTRLTQFLQNAPDAVIVINEAQLVVEWNLKAEKIFGFSREKALHQPLAELIIPLPYREAHKKGMQHFLKTGEGPVLNTTIEVAAIDKLGKEFPISLSISNINIDNQWFFIAFIEDISDKIKKQEEFVRQQIELNEVREDDKRNRDFLNIASHELKTPLTGIKAFAQLALRGIDRNSKEKTAEYLKRIDESSDKLKTLIFSLLDISKIQAGKFQVSKTVVEYSRYLEAIVDTSRIIFPYHKILIKRNDTAHVNLDEIRVEQVIMNLINNAVKYSPGSDLIEITTRVDNHMIITDVKDYGIGISKNNQNKIFEKFFQLHELSKTDNSGLGIGLFISPEIIKQHNGSMWVQSNETKGSTFSFSLPVVEDYN